MKGFACAVGLALLAACSRADDTAADTTLPAMAPAPTTTPIDTGLKMDTTRRDATKSGATTSTKAKQP